MKVMALILLSVVLVGVSVGVLAEEDSSSLQISKEEDVFLVAVKEGKNVSNFSFRSEVELEDAEAECEIFYPLLPQENVRLELKGKKLSGEVKTFPSDRVVVKIKIVKPDSDEPVDVPVTMILLQEVTVNGQTESDVIWSAGPLEGESAEEKNAKEEVKVKGVVPTKVAEPEKEEKKKEEEIAPESVQAPLKQEQETRSKKQGARDKEQTVGNKEKFADIRKTIEVDKKEIGELNGEITLRVEKREKSLEKNKLFAQRDELANENLLPHFETDSLTARVQTLSSRVDTLRRQYELTQEQVGLEEEEKSLKKGMKEIKNPGLQFVFNGGILAARRTTTYSYSEEYYDSYYDESGEYVYEEYQYEPPEPFGELGLRYPFGKGPSFAIAGIIGGNSKKEGYVGLQGILPVVKAISGSRSVIMFEAGGVYYFKTDSANSERSLKEIPVFPVLGIALESRDPGIRFFLQGLPGDEYPLRVGLGWVLSL